MIDWEERLIRTSLGEFSLKIMMAIINGFAVTICEAKTEARKKMCMVIKPTESGLSYNTLRNYKWNMKSEMLDATTKWFGENFEVLDEVLSMEEYSRRVHYKEIMTLKAISAQTSGKTTLWPPYSNQAWDKVKGSQEHQYSALQHRSNFEIGFHHTY